MNTNNNSNGKQSLSEVAAAAYTASRAAHQNKAIATLNCVRKFGVEPSIIAHVAINNFSIAPVYSQLFPYQKKLFWDCTYLLAQICNGTITRDNREFIVIYHNCSRGQILTNSKVSGKQAVLSFREALPDFLIPAYVLVRLETATD